MARRRANESALATEQGIEEVVIQHRKTKSGRIRTTQKTVPVVIPVNQKASRSSRSKTKKKDQAVVELAGQSTPLDTEIDDLQVPQYIDEGAGDDMFNDDILPDKSAKSTVSNHTPFQ